MASHLKLSQAKLVKSFPILSLFTTKPIGCTSKSLNDIIAFSKLVVNVLTWVTFAVSTFANSFAK